MTENADWAKDPVVLLEKDVIPVFSAGLGMLCDLLSGNPPETDDPRFEVFNRTNHAFRSLGQDYFTGIRLVFDTDDTAICLAAAECIRTAQLSLTSLIARPENEALRKNVHQQLTRGLPPKIEAALDVFRKLFIGKVLAQQRNQARQAQAAISKLDEISKQIFYVSINASIQAARAGSEGLGFVQVSKEIRELSQTAQATTRTLSGLM